MGSFRAASDVLHMSPQLVGKHVQALEEHLGMQLLHRTTRRQSLTDFGRLYLERERAILEEVANAEGMAAEALAKPSGLLRLNAPVSFGIHTLTRHLSDFMRQHSEIRVDLSQKHYRSTFRTKKVFKAGLLSAPSCGR